METVKIHPIDRFVKENGISYQELAELCGVQYSSMWAYRIGKRRPTKHIRLYIELVTCGGIKASEL